MHRIEGIVVSLLELVFFLLKVPGPQIRVFGAV